MALKFLYGTAWKENDTTSCVRDALLAGFRGIDTANQRKHYFEQAVGVAIDEAVQSKSLSRADLFLQTKYTFMAGQDQRLPYDPKATIAKQVKQSFLSSLEHLSTDHLDSYILHGPSTSQGIVLADQEAWRAMEEIHSSGGAKQLGVSNVNFEQLKSFYEFAKVKPSYVQNRCFARTGWDKKIRQYCQEHNIMYQGFSLLTANGEVFQQPAFAKIVRDLGCTPAQAIFQFSIQVGMLPLTGTTNPDHMKIDLQCEEFKLSAEQVKVIEDILL